MGKLRYQWERNLATKHPDVNLFMFDGLWAGPAAVGDILNPDEKHYAPKTSAPSIYVLESLGKVTQQLLFSHLKGL